MRPAYLLSLPGQAGELGVLSDSSGRPWARGKDEVSLEVTSGYRPRGEEVAERPRVHSLIHTLIY